MPRLSPLPPISCSPLPPSCFPLSPPPLAFRFPLSAFRSRGGPRRAVTILEVLFAILVTTIGLLGAIAIFPVASAQARKGRQNDIVAVAADSISHQFDTQYMRRPDQWRAWSPNPAPNYYPIPTFVAANVFTAGQSYCIDPRFVAANFGTLDAFPAHPGAVAGMVRVSLSPSPASMLGAMTRWQADQVFAIEDELIFERPGTNSVNSDNALPAFQNYDKILDVNSGNLVASRRQEAGDLTWMATVVPKLDRSVSPPAFTDLFTLSIVVFSKRSPELFYDRRNTAANPAIIPAAEYLAEILPSDLYGGGIGGGEVAISVRLDANVNDNIDHATVLDQIRRGSWVMLSARTTTGGNGNAVFNWYRVSDAGVDQAEDPLNPYTVAGQQYWRRDFTLIGPDWQLFDADGDGNAEPVQVTIIPGVIAVYERTIRLEQDFTGL